MSRRLGRCLVEVGIGEVGMDTLQEPVERRRVRDVNGLGLRLASIADEETTDTSLAVNDDRARVTWGGERAGLLIVRKDRPLHRRPLSVIREVLAYEGLDAGSATNGHACGATALDYHEAMFTFRVEQLWVAQLVFPDDALKRQEAVVKRILEGREGGVVAGGKEGLLVGAHAPGKVDELNLCTWI